VVSIPDHGINQIDLTVTREEREDIPPRRHMEGSSREWIGSLFKSGKRVHRVPSRQPVSSRNHTREGAHPTRQKSPKRHIATVLEEPDDESIAAQRPSLRLNPSVENFAYRASEGRLSRSSPQDLTRALLSLRAENQQLFTTQERLEEQERKLALAQAEVSRMQDELEDEKKKSAEAENAKNKAIRNLAQASVKADPYKYDDVFFKREFKKFRYEVSHWVRNQKWQLARNRSIPEHFKLLKTTTPYYVDYIYSEKGMQLLVEARIWQYLTADVFDKDLWVDGGIEEKEIDKIGRAHVTLKDMFGRRCSTVRRKSIKEFPYSTNRFSGSWRVI
jgi:hypothetical protein